MVRSRLRLGRPALAFRSADVPSAVRGHLARSRQLRCGKWMGEVESDAFITNGRALATDGHHFLVASGGRGAIFERGATVPAATFTIELPGEISEVRKRQQRGRETRFSWR